MPRVGYKSPPVAHRFAPGVSGNPAGGKRGPRKKVRPHPFDELIKVPGAKRSTTMPMGRHILIIAINMATSLEDERLRRIVRTQIIRIERLMRIAKPRTDRVFYDSIQWCEGDEIENHHDAVQHLGIGRLLRANTKKPQTVLEPFIVQAAIDRMVPNRLTRDQQRRVIDTTSSAWKLNLPDWWEPDIRGTKRCRQDE